MPSLVSVLSTFETMTLLEFAGGQSVWSTRLPVGALVLFCLKWLDSRFSVAPCLTRQSWGEARSPRPIQPLGLSSSSRLRPLPPLLPWGALSGPCFPLCTLLPACDQEFGFLFLSFFKGSSFKFYLFLYFQFFWPHCMPCRILVPGPGIKPMLPALEAWILNHWTARRVFAVLFLFLAFYTFYFALIS